MQPSRGRGSLRRALFGVLAVVLLVVCGIGIASAATGHWQALPAAHKAQAKAKAQAPAGAVRSHAKAPVGVVRYHGHVLGLAPPLSGQQGRSRSAAKPL